MENNQANVEFSYYFCYLMNKFCEINETCWFNRGPLNCFT